MTELWGAASKGGEEVPSSSLSPWCNQEAAGNAELSTDVLMVVRTGETRERKKFPWGLPHCLPPSQNAASQDCWYTLHAVVHSFLLPDHLLQAWHQATGWDAMVRPCPCFPSNG